MGAVLDGVPDGLLVLKYARRLVDTVIVYANSAAAEVYGEESVEALLALDRRSGFNAAEVELYDGVLARLPEVGSVELERLDCGRVLRLHVAYVDDAGESGGPFVVVVVHRSMRAEELRRLESDLAGVHREFGRVIARRVEREAARATGADVLVERLTRRQVQAVVGVADGLTYGEIALEWGVGLGTVEKHVAGARAKLGIEKGADMYLALLGRLDVVAVCRGFLGVL